MPSWLRAAKAAIAELGAVYLDTSALGRVLLREGLLPAADQLLTSVALLPLDENVLATAESLPPSTVRTLDAIHLATALRVAATTGLDALLTYDAQLAAGAREHGLTTLAPG